MIFSGKLIGSLSKPELIDRVMAAKEAELRKTIDDQSGEIADLRKSNNRMKEEIFARVSQTSPSD
jgi:hypothetical protein